MLVLAKNPLSASLRRQVQYGGSRRSFSKRKFNRSRAAGAGRIKRRGESAIFEPSTVYEEPALGYGRNFFLVVGFFPLFAWGAVLYFNPELQDKIADDTRSLRNFLWGGKSDSRAKEETSPSIGKSS